MVTVVTVVTIVADMQEGDSGGRCAQLLFNFCDLATHQVKHNWSQVTTARLHIRPGLPAQLTPTLQSQEEASSLHQASSNYRLHRSVGLCVA